MNSEDLENSSTEDRPRWSHPGNQPDVYVRCPYFPEHELRRSRLLYHLPKCQNNPSAPNLLVCPFNFLHRIRPEDRQKHLEECPDKIVNRIADKPELPSFGATAKQMRDPKNANYKTAQIVNNHLGPKEAFIYTGQDEDEW